MVNGTSSHVPQIIVMHLFFCNASPKYYKGPAHYEKEAHYKKPGGHITKKETHNKKLVAVTSKVPRNPKQEPLYFYPAINVFREMGQQ